MATDDDRTASQGAAREIDLSAPPVLVKGGYQILLTRDPDSIDGSPAYVLATRLGQPLREGLSLAEARLLLDRYVEDEARAQNAALSPRSRIRR